MLCVLLLRRRRLPRDRRWLWGRMKVARRVTSPWSLNGHKGRVAAQAIAGNGTPCSALLLFFAAPQLEHLARGPVTARPCFRTARANAKPDPLSWKTIKRLLSLRPREGARRRGSRWEAAGGLLPSLAVHHFGLIIDHFTKTN